MPRLRAEMIMQAGQGDLMVGLVKVAERDFWGSFFPMLGSEWTLITDRSDAPSTVQELLDLPNIRVNVVRGFNAGPAYQAMLAALDKQGKLEYVNDAQTVVRKMKAGRVDFTYMPSNTFAGALDEMGIKDSYGKSIRYLKLGGIPPTVIGVYLSRRMAPDDSRQVDAVLTQMRHDGALMTGLRRYFSPMEMSSSFALPGMNGGR
jgi:polar amino acid transport system substrate-binding protein